LTAAQAKKLTASTQPWLSCDSCFEQIDAYVDALVGGEAGLDEPLRVHLARCPACYEEAETLAGLAAQDQGVSEERTLDALRAGVRPAADVPVRSRRRVTRLLRRR
jgi:predicted Zn-dependent protease